MRLLRQYQFFFLFLALLAFCSFMVVRQFRVNRSKHVDLREAFILLHTKGYTNQAVRLFTRLVSTVYQESEKTLVDDFQRTLMLVDPGTPHPENLIWKYHWTVANELDKRSESSLRHALKLAEEN